MLCDRVRVELIIHNPSLLLEVLVDWFEILSNIGSKSVAHAGFHIDVDNAPNRTVIVFRMLTAPGLDSQSKSRQFGRFAAHCTAL